MFGDIFSLSQIGIGGDARGMSEDELRLRDAQLGWAYANYDPGWIGMENYRPPSRPLPPLPAGWAEWFQHADELQ